MCAHIRITYCVYCSHEHSPIVLMYYDVCIHTYVQVYYWYVQIREQVGVWYSKCEAMYVVVIFWINFENSYFVLFVHFKLFFVFITLQVMFVMTPGIQRQQHSFLDKFQYHKLANNLSPALMNVYIGTVYCMW